MLLVTISSAKSLFSLEICLHFSLAASSVRSVDIVVLQLKCSFFGREFEALCGERCTSLICHIFYRHSAALVAMNDSVHIFSFETQPEGYSQFNSALEPFLINK